VYIGYLTTVVACAGLSHIKNEDIRKELTIQLIQNKVDEYKQNWVNHLSKMTNERVPCCSVNQKVTKAKEDLGKDGMNMCSWNGFGCQYHEGKKKKNIGMSGEEYGS
jgi:hypothetical protein